MVIAHMYSEDCNPVHVALFNVWRYDIPLIYDEIDRTLVEHGIAVRRGHWYGASDVPRGHPPPRWDWQGEAEIARVKEDGQWEELQKVNGHINQE
ncbi:hypothetical protein IAR50_003563 [Cryptococcus sp. DSM 104548]